VHISVEDGEISMTSYLDPAQQVVVDETNSTSPEPLPLEIIEDIEEEEGDFEAKRLAA